MRAPNLAWATYVQGVLDKHGATRRSQRQRTGISHTTVNSWLEGVKPGYEGVIDFARGMGEEPAEALVAAGYEPITATSDDPEVAADQFVAALTAGPGAGKSAVTRVLSKLETIYVVEEMENFLNPVLGPLLEQRMRELRKAGQLSGDADPPLTKAMLDIVREEAERAGVKEPHAILLEKGNLERFRETVRLLINDLAEEPEP